jgi:serine phosphatase RsbU (regulator of sigma subunit)
MSQHQDEHFVGRALQCMEITGGSQAVEQSLATPGIDAWVFSRPFEGAEGGGDVHYLSLCGGGVITRVILADVSGHGADVADVSVSLRALMRKNINNKSQTALVRALNKQFTELAQLRRFATAVVATYLAVGQTLTVCNAGHPRPLWRRADTGQWALLDQDVGSAGNLPLGLDDETPYNQFTVPLGRDDLVLFYTDALIEAADPSGRQLGEEGLLALVRGLEAGTPPELGRALLGAVERHRGGRPADDDVTLFALQHNAGGPRRLSIVEKLDVYAKVFRLKGD